MHRRINSSDFDNVKAKTTHLDLPVVSVLTNPQYEWKRIAHSGRKIAGAIDVDWKQYNPVDYLFSHCSIVSSVQVEPNGYYIKPVCNQIVNANGNSWTNEILLATFKSFIGGFNFLEHCFIKGTRVLMSDGIHKDIDKIIPGEFIINRKGVPDKVVNVQKRKSSDVKKIKSVDILSRDLFVTGNHPFWTYSARETCPISGKKNNFNYGKHYFKIDRWTGVAPSVKMNGENPPCGVVPSWKEAKEIDWSRDFLTHPVSNFENHSLDLNENRAELLGWFLAEGCLTSLNKSHNGISGVCFSLGNKEINVAERLSRLLTEEFGHTFRTNCEPRIYYTKSGSINVHLCNRAAGEFFLKHGNQHSWEKKVSDDVLWAKKRIQAIILKSYLNGDGCGKIKSRGYSVNSKSKDLIQQLLFISWRLGLNPIYKESGVLKRYSKKTIVNGYEIYINPENNKKSRPGFYLSYNVSDSKKINLLSGSNDNELNLRKSRGITHIFEDNRVKTILCPISEVSDTELKDVDVYNIEVENDNSYIAEGVVVHNCQIPSQSKGTILDAVLRPFTYKDVFGNSADVFICDILVATSRKHWDLIQKIQTGLLSTLSMGTTCRHVTCSKCGGVFADDDDSCDHIKHELLSTFKDENGITRIVSEICGRMIKNPVTGEWEGDPESNKFIEASWVENPAFKGAVLNHFVEPQGFVSDKYAALMEEKDLDLSVSEMMGLRVADRFGMAAIRLAQQEYMRSSRIETIERILKGK